MILLACALAVLAMAMCAGGQTPPPSDGDWIVSDDTTVVGGTVPLNGSLVVEDGGVLTLIYVNLTLNSSDDGSVGIQVRSGGKLVVEECVINSSSDHNYSFRVIGELWLGNSTITDLWQSGGPIESAVGGLYILSDDVTVTHCTFTRNDRIAMYVKSSSPVIKDSVFSESNYFTFKEEGSGSLGDCYRDAYGIVAFDSTLQVTNCTFLDLGDFDGVLDDASDHYQSRIRLHAYGIYAIRCHLEVRDSLFTEIGRLPDKNYIWKYFPSYGDRVLMDFSWQGDRNGIYTSASPDVKVTECEFTKNYKGYGSTFGATMCIQQNSGDSWVANNAFTNNNGGAISVRDGRSVFTDNVVHDFRGNAISAPYFVNVTVFNNTFNGTADTRDMHYETGIWIAYRGGTHTIHNNTFTYCQYALYVRTNVRVVARDCHISHCEPGIYQAGEPLHLYNVSVEPEDVEFGQDLGTVLIHFELGVRVAWQNGIPMEADVTVTNGTGATLLQRRTGEDGVMAPVTLLSARVAGNRDGRTVADNRDLTVGVNYSTLGTSKGVRFVRNVDLALSIVDPDPPELTILLPRQDQYQDSLDLLVRGTAFDAGSGLEAVEVSVDEATWAPATGMVAWEVTMTLQQGVYTVYARTSDAAGNDVVVSVGNVTIDTGPPLLDVERLRDGYAYASNHFVMEGTAIDEGSGLAWVRVSADDTTWTPAMGLGMWTATLELPDGVYGIHVMASDRGGNATTLTFRNVTIDTVFPVCDLGPDVHLSLGESVTLDATGCSDNIAIHGRLWTYKEEDGSWGNSTGSSITLSYSAPGDYWATLEIVDRVGHTATDRVEISVRDTEPPVAVAGEDVDVDQGVEVTFSAEGSSDNLGIVRYQWTLEDAGVVHTLEGLECVFAFTVAGEHRVVLNVTDEAGNWAEDGLTVQVRDVTLPVASAGDDVDVGQGAEVTFDGTASGDDVAVVRWTWTFEEAGEEVTLTGATAYRAFPIPGEYVVTLTVEDAAGNQATDDLVVLVRDTEPPVPKASYNTTVKAREEVTLDASGTTDNVGVASYRWLFLVAGEPVTLTGRVVAHVFLKPGLYHINLTVTDAAGNSASEAFTIEVTKRGGGGTSGTPGFGAIAAVVSIALAVAAGARLRDPRRP